MNLWSKTVHVTQKSLNKKNPTVPQLFAYFGCVSSTVFYHMNDFKHSIVIICRKIVVQIAALLMVHTISVFAPPCLSNHAYLKRH